MVNDIVDALNSEPTMLQTESGVAVGVPHYIGKEHDSNDELLINKLKRTTKKKYPTNEAAFEKHMHAMLARGQGKRAAADTEEPSTVKNAAKLSVAVEVKDLGM